MYSHGLVINEAAMVRKDKNYPLNDYIFLKFPPPPGRQQDAESEEHSTVPDT